MSHMFDRKFIPRVVKGPQSWEHEHASAAMLDALIKDNNLADALAKWGIGPAEIHLTKELIFGGPSDAPPGWEWRGRGKHKQFLFEIVANKRSGIDTDKWDYFARDCHHLGMKWSFDALRLMRFSRVLMVDNEAQLCYHEKEGREGGRGHWLCLPLFTHNHHHHRHHFFLHLAAWNLYELFHTRYECCSFRASCIGFLVA